LRFFSESPDDHFESEFVSIVESIAVPPSFATAFREVVHDLLQDRRQSAIATAGAIEKRLQKAHARKQSLLQAFLYDKSIDKEDFDEQRSILEGEIRECEAAIADLNNEDLDFDSVLEFAAHLLQHPADAWVNADLEQKQRLQKVFFPDGVRFGSGKFETDAKGLLFRDLAPLPARKPRLVAHTGFEPVLPP
jgi:hypothetical protein